MGEYREIAPPPQLSRSVECFWTMSHPGPEPPNRVMPDGCADILFTRSSAGASLEAVGPMTSYFDFQVGEALQLVGVRFPPGMWTTYLGVPGDRVTDQTVPLDALWGAKAKELSGRLGDALASGKSLEQC